MDRYGVLLIIHGVTIILHSGDITIIMAVAIMAAVYGVVATGVAVFIPAEQTLLITDQDQTEVAVIILAETMVS